MSTVATLLRSDPRPAGPGTGLESPLDSVPSELEPLVAQMLELMTLRPGWNSYKAAAISEQAVISAIRLLTAVHWQAPLPSVTPTPSGGVMLEWGDDDTGVELEIAADGSATVLVDNGVEPPWESTVYGAADGVLGEALRWAAKLAQ